MLESLVKELVVEFNVVTMDIGIGQGIDQALVERIEIIHTARNVLLQHLVEDLNRIVKTDRRIDQQHLAEIEDLVLFIQFGDER